MKIDLMIDIIRSFNLTFSIVAIVGWFFGIYFIFQNQPQTALISWSIPTGIGLGESINRIFFQD